MLNPALDAFEEWPFTRLARLLADIAPGGAPLNLALGEPQMPPPDFVDPILGEAGGWNRYPPIAGTPGWQRAVGDWLVRRYGDGGRLIDPPAMALPASGTREAIYMLAQLAVPSGPPAPTSLGAGSGTPGAPGTPGATGATGARPAVLLPNPYYAPYLGAAIMAGAEAVALPARANTGFLPDLDAIPAETLARTRLFYLCSPTNPQGRFADAAYLGRALDLARAHGFVLVVDECYAEVWDRHPPTGALEVAAARDGGRLDNLLVVHSLSKRSSAAGLRSGFVAGDPTVIAGFRRLRGFAAAGMPLAILEASAALWSDDGHVEATRARYRAAFDAAARHLDGAGFVRPDGGFFAWLPVADGERAALDLWRETGVRALPGGYIATAPADGGTCPGSGYLRLACVHPPALLEETFARAAPVLARHAVPPDAAAADGGVAAAAGRAAAPGPAS